MREEKEKGFFFDLDLDFDLDLILFLREKKIFQCDPHPGNIMVDTESSLLPKIGLIDYGQSKQVTRGEQESLARLYVAMARARDAPLTEVCSALDEAESDEVAAAFKALGIVTEITPLGLASGLTERDLILNTSYRMWDSRYFNLARKRRQRGRKRKREQKEKWWKV